ncbi:MAG: extracellular solute-binding protein [Actinomycetota bacterium]|nr:extracellular solute-binding protein [Actinomycetota bacterium]
MRIRWKPRLAAVTAVVMLVGLLAACTGSETTETTAAGNDTTTVPSEGEGTTTTSGPAEPEPVTLRVVSLLPGSDEAAFTAFDERVAEFEALYPHITVESEEYEWRATTFAAALAGGTLPDVFEIPLTDAKALADNGQIADIDDQVQALPYAADFNEALLEAGRGADGRVYAVPAKSIYGVALHYNRALFEQAGLDPDDPPTTWDEVRAAAKAIKDATGTAGYAQMAMDNTGGWQITAATYSRGGRIQVANDDGTHSATLDNPGTRAALEFLQALRWEDDSLLPDATINWVRANETFAAGQVGMYTSGSDVYTALAESFGVTEDSSGLRIADYGLTAIPNEGSDSGVLVGGTLAAVNVRADDAIKDAAIKWIDFFYLRTQLEEGPAVANAEVRFGEGQPVGTPVLPIFSREQYETSLGWIADFINVPLDNMTGYTSVMFDQPVVGEPSVATQETYALLDVAVQAVMTDPNADIDALLQTANTAAEALLEG